MHREKVKVCPKCRRPFPVKGLSSTKKGECPHCNTKLCIPVRGDPIIPLVLIRDVCTE